MTAIMVGTPCYSGTVTINYMHSLLNAINLLKRENIAVQVLTTAHDSLITRARNHIANEFLRQEGYSHLLFIDSDIGFSPSSVLRFIRADKDVVCGIYPIKGLHVDRLRNVDRSVPDAEATAAALMYTVKIAPDSKIEDGFVRVTYGSTGFMLIKREVLLRMKEAYPELRYTNAFVPAGQGRENCAFFDTAIDAERGEYLPEDYAFCQRWTALGGEVHADLSSNFTHVGQYVYAGDFSAFLTHAQPAAPESDAGR